MKLNELTGKIPGARLVGDGSVEVRKPRVDSRQVEAGDLFCAIVGEQVDGNCFIEQAVEHGAKAVLTTKPEAANGTVPAIVVKDDRVAMAYAAHALYNEPTRRARLWGLTGTNGKTTSTHILQSILEADGRTVGRIGTIGWQVGSENHPLERTTPEAPELLEIMDRMVATGATDIVMEVTSIAMPLKRVEGFQWAGGMFTNLSQDHLDLHGSMEEYFQAKRLFFNELKKPAIAVANVDDSYGSRMLQGVNVPQVRCGLEGDALDVQATILSETPSGMTLKVRWKSEEFELNAPYVGRFNAENILCCVSLALGIGIKPETVQRGVLNAPQVRGRMERLVLENGVVAIVDYAHTPDALKRALLALRPMTEGKLFVVVGAGGDRDQTKRPIMGQVAEENADRTIITSDNPRTEDPAQIVRDVTARCEGEHVVAIVDRREAIGLAMNEAKAGDVILIAGKGHETYQDVNNVKHHFDDREEVLNLCREASC